MAKRKVEELDLIPYEDVKVGQYIQLKNRKFYVVCKYHDDYKLIPIDLNNVITRSKDYGIFEGDIIAVYDAKNGNLIKRRKANEVEGE